MKAATFQQRKGFVGLCISIHAAREGGDPNNALKRQAVFISIHAAREGGDAITDDVLPKGSISIHAAREGGDQTSEVDALYNRLFQSTPPVKAATKRGKSYANAPRFQSTPPVKAATLQRRLRSCAWCYFNPRRP